MEAPQEPGCPCADPTTGRQARGGLTALYLAVGVLSVAVAACFGWGSGGTEPIGEPRSVTYEELESAVEDAARVLLEAPGVEVVEEILIDGERGSAMWADFRPNRGVAFVEVWGDVSTSAFGKVLGATPVAQVHTREARLVAAGGDATWSAEPGGSLVTPPVAAPMDQMPLMLEPVRNEGDVEATRQASSDGGTVWTLSAPDHTPFESQLWAVHPEGHLRGYTATLADVGEEAIDGRLETTYRMVTNPEPLPQPEPGAELDLQLFDLPDGFLAGKK